MFSKDNPSGDIPDASWYQTLLILCIVIPFLVAVKRYYTGLAQGRRLYNRYGEELSRVMERVLFINKVGKLAISRVLASDSKTSTSKWQIIREETQQSDLRIPVGTARTSL
jgi:hypothetical protein